MYCSHNTLKSFVIIFKCPLTEFSGKSGGTGTRQIRLNVVQNFQMQENWNNLSNSVRYVETISFVRTEIGYFMSIHFLHLNILTPNSFFFVSEKSVLVLVAHATWTSRKHSNILSNVGFRKIKTSISWLWSLLIPIDTFWVVHLFSLFLLLW